MIGRIELQPGRWATLGRDLVWRSDDLPPEIVEALNRDFWPVARTPSEGWRGYGEVEAAAKHYGVRAEYGEYPKLPPDAVP